MPTSRHSAELDRGHFLKWLGRPGSSLKRRGQHPSGGQSVAEFALVAPILLLILATILQFSYIFGAQIGVTNATREAARNAAATTPTLDTTTASMNGDFAYKRLLDTWLPRNVMAYDASGIVTATGTTQVCYSKYTDPSGETAIQVTVTTVYGHPLFIPLVSNILDAIDGSSDGRFRVSSSETMRVANPDQLPTYTGDIPAAGVCYQ